MRCRSDSSWCIVLLAGCTALPADGRERLLDEMRTLLERPAWRERVLERALMLHDPRCLRFAEAFLEDPDQLVQREAWWLRVDLDEHDPGATFRAALAHPDWFVRSYAAQAAGRRAPGDPAIDAALERTLQEETVGGILQHAARSYAERRHGDGARRVFELLGARGPAWIVCGLEVYARFPAPEFTGAFRDALASNQLDQRILGARGLLAIGALAADDPARQTAARRTYDEFDEYLARIDRDHGPARPSSWDEVVSTAANARVVVLGESHGSILEGAVQCALLGELAQLSEAPLTLLYERPMQHEQRLPVTAAALLRIGAELIEAEPKEPPTVFERDEEARANMLQRLEADPERRFIVVYGNGHRESFVRCLREHGIRAVGITTAGNGEMLAAAWTCAGTLAVRGRVFRFADGTYYVAAQPQVEDLRDRELPTVGANATR